MDHDILIVGGGLIGCASAWHLAKAGMAPLLVEAGFLNVGASGQNAGSLHFQIERRFLEQGTDAAAQAAGIVHLSKLAIADWAGLEDQLARPLDIAMHGGLMLAESDADMALLRFKVAREQELGLGTQLLDGAAVRDLAPYLAGHIQGAAYLAQEGHANPRILTDAFAKEAVQHGTQIRTGTRLVSLTMMSEGGYRVLLQDAGGTSEVTSRRLLLATGAWTARIAQMLGLHVPLYPVPLSMNVTDRTALFLPFLIQHVGKRLSMKQSEDGNLLIGGGWPSRLARDEAGAIDLDRPPLPDEAQIRANLAVAAGVLPALRDRQLIRSWTGTTCISADQLPIVGMIDAAPGLYVAAGGSMFTLGPLLARLLSQQIVAGDDGPDAMAMFLPRRFNHLNAFTLLP
jgi:sarcosine oxidase subunit beta